MLPPEWLDSLPANAPEAQASRRDLRVFNALLGSRRWLASVVRRELRSEERVLEIGAGDGATAAAMLARGMPWDALDLAAMPEKWPSSGRWFQSDALGFVYPEEHAVVVANLLLHHFTETQLARLGERLRGKARVLIVNDLERSGWRVHAFGLLCRVIGAHAVSRHDGALSIRAGFRDEELPIALGLTREKWRWRVTHTLFGAYRLVAVKRS